VSSIGVVLESLAESRVAATPETVKAIRALGYQVLVEKGAGAKPLFPTVLMWQLEPRPLLLRWHGRQTLS